MLGRPSTTKLLHFLSNHDPTSPFYLLKASLSAFGMQLGSPALPKLLLTLFTFGQSSLSLSLALLDSLSFPLSLFSLFRQVPTASKAHSLLLVSRFSYPSVCAGQVFLVQNLTRFIDDPSIPSERCWALVGGFVIIYSGIALSTYWYWEKVFGVLVEYRGGLVGAM